MLEQTTTYERQQRRRAIIAWSAALAVILFAAAAVLGARHRSGESERPNAFANTMSSEQFDSLRPGMDREEFSDLVENAGLPEDRVALAYLRLFPPPAEGISCSFWQISDRIEALARVCFSDADGRLVEKLEHGVGGEGDLGVPA